MEQDRAHVSGVVVSRSQPWYRVAFDWLFRNRDTGQITIVQFPNFPLVAFFLLALATRFLTPTGSMQLAADFLTTGLIIWWAVLEVGWGVNPFRRGLGAVVLVLSCVGFLLG